MEFTVQLQLAQFIAYFIGVTVFIVMIKADVKVLTVQINGILKNLELLNLTISQNAIQDMKISRLEEDIREMKHGRGFINVDGEWAKAGKVS